MNGDRVIAVFAYTPYPLDIPIPAAYNRMCIYNIYNIMRNDRMGSMKIILSNQDKTPIYEQLENQLRNAILTGQLTEGERLPPIRTLAVDLGVSIITVKRAYQDLENEGYIHTAVGRGSFVAGQNVSRLKDETLQRMEQELHAHLAAMRSMGASKADIQRIVAALWKESEDHARHRNPSSS